MTRFSRLAGGTALVLALGALAHAGIQMPFTLTRPTNFSQQLTFAGYDSSQGPLRGVSLCLRWKHERIVRCENLDAEPATVEIAFTPANVSVRRGPDVLASLDFTGFVDANTLPVFDGSLDYAGPSSCFRRTVEQGFQLLSFDDPAVIAAFIDVPTVTLDFEGDDIFSVAGPGNVCADSQTRITLDGFVVYDN